MKQITDHRSKRMKQIETDENRSKQMKQIETDRNRSNRKQRNQITNDCEIKCEKM